MINRKKMLVVKVGCVVMTRSTFFSAKHIQGWSTNWNGPTYSLADEVQTSTGIFTPSLSVAKKNVDNAYYTLQGMKLLQKPTKAGIYIHHGKKMRIAK